MNIIVSQEEKNKGNKRNSRTIACDDYRARYYRPLEKELNLISSWPAIETFKLTLNSYGLPLKVFKRVLTQAHKILRDAIGDGTWCQSLEFDDTWHVHYVIFSTSEISFLDFNQKYLDHINPYLSRNNLKQRVTIDHICFEKVTDPKSDWINYCLKRNWHTEGTLYNYRFGLKKRPILKDKSFKEWMKNRVYI